MYRRDPQNLPELVPTPWIECRIRSLDFITYVYDLISGSPQLTSEPSPYSHKAFVDRLRMSLILHWRACYWTFPQLLIVGLLGFHPTANICFPDSLSILSGSLEAFLMLDGWSVARDVYTLGIS